ncbi:aminoglycoside phosphotransferase family protein (plasmid) [Cytobacillus spongiae]|uniref:aminoglycoside phosphotransferase family protein n=1 Tax=Cytobacillus spongiae TaxID=2901381 RepID=UPI001F1D1B0A|nr:aminoglycoside phosphotransferase family protein [Cytobacillus spongiae]UII58183.1 aminoglycoside phosphotransferase family protein [Cytobacillus spongiae]
MEINGLLEKLKVNEVDIISSVAESKDSSVWKVVLKEGSVLAVRISEKENLNRFKREEAIMKYVRKMGIPCPLVYRVENVAQHSIMLMEWVEGKTVFHHLLERPQESFGFGVKFGVMQAMLHNLPVHDFPYHISENWLKPKSDIEEELLSKCHNEKHSLLHLDYHPLNVLINVDGVIDWANCSYGDYHLDLARTLSILEIQGSQFFSDTTISTFIKGWYKGYRSKREDVGDLSPYVAWAGERMKFDMGSQLDEKGKREIDDWVRNRTMMIRSAEIGF